jgi:hypothetical protein
MQNKYITDIEGGSGAAAPSLPHAIAAVASPS